VRNADEVARSGKARGAINIPLMLLSMQADPRSPECRKELSAGAPIAVYCASGGRSGSAVALLKRMGHAEAHNIGGLGDWVAAGGKLG